MFVCNLSGASEHSCASVCLFSFFSVAPVCQLARLLMRLSLVGSRHER